MGKKPTKKELKKRFYKPPEPVIKEAEELKFYTRLPDQERLRQNLQAIDSLLGLEEEDYSPISQEELRNRIDTRMQEQDNVIYPQRLAEGAVTNEWTAYIRGRER